MHGVVVKAVMALVEPKALHLRHVLHVAVQGASKRWYVRCSVM